MAPRRLSSSYDELRLSSDSTSHDMEEALSSTTHNGTYRYGRLQSGTSGTGGHVRRWSLPTLASLDTIATSLDNTSSDQQLPISPAAEPSTTQVPVSPAVSILLQDLIPHVSSASYPRSLAHSRNTLSKSTRKLGQIFGNDAPIDVRVREIEETRLAALLQSRIPLLYFLAMTIADQNAENLVRVDERPRP